MEETMTVLYEAIQHESDEFAKGDLISPITQRTKGKNTSIENIVYAVVAVGKRWSRWRLTIGKREIESVFSEEVPSGEAWKRDFLYEIQPLCSIDGKRLLTKAHGSMRAAGWYFRRSTIHGEAAILLLESYVEGWKALLREGELRGDFYELSKTLEIIASKGNGK
jgi:hypothetical protein